MEEKVRNKTKPVLLIIDSNALIHRAYHALPPLTTASGDLINAVYGFFSLLFKAIREIAPQYIATTFDSPGPTFRQKIYPPYKATRVKAPQELYDQIPRIKELLNSLGILVIAQKGYEADDLIGTIARQVKKIDIIILSGDKDLLQLVNDRTKIMLLKRGLSQVEIYDREAVRQKYEGLRVDQLLDLKALQGDKSDNIPGAPGIGEKTAIKLLKQFGSLDNLYKEMGYGLAEIEEKKQATLRENHQQILLSRKLGKIKQDVEISFELEKCSQKSYNKARAKKAFQVLGFNNLLNYLP